MSLGRRAILLLFTAALGLCLFVSLANGSDELRTASELSGKVEEPEENSPRTATGGIINTLLCLLTVVAFLGNAAFLVYVFFYSK
jgi:hypothetical protein